MNKVSLALSGILTAGCVAHVEGERPLSQENKEIVEALLEQESTATRMAMEVAKKLEYGIVNAKGETATHQDLLSAMQQTATWLHASYAEGRIMEADTSLFVSADTIAQYDTQEDPYAHQDDHIVVATNSEFITLETLMHEAGHKDMWHDPFVTQEIRDTGADWNAGYAQAVITHHDYPFLLSGLYNIPEKILKENNEDISEALKEAQKAAEVGDVIKGKKILKESLELSSEDFEEMVREKYQSAADMFAAFGISEDEYVDAGRKSEIYQELVQERKEAREAFASEYESEARRERRIR